MRKKIFFGLSLLLVMVVIAGCTNGLLDTGADDGHGELVMKISDGPVNEIENVWIYIDEVRVQREDEGWITLNDFDGEDDDMLTVDLLDLKFTEELLGQETLEAGNYNKIRLKLAAEYEDGEHRTGQNSMSRIVYEDGTEQNLTVPAGVQKGFQIDYDFTLEDNSIVELLIDVELSKLAYAGNSDKVLLNTQAVNVIDTYVTGNILGQVVAENESDEPASIENLIENDVIVEAYQAEDYDEDNDEFTEEPVSSSVVLPEPEEETDKETGEFLLRGLPEGEYYLKAYVVTSEGEVDESEYQIYTSTQTFAVKAGETNELEDSLLLERSSTEE